MTLSRKTPGTGEPTPAGQEESPTIPGSILYRAFIDSSGKPVYNYISNSLKQTKQFQPASAAKDHLSLLEMIHEEDRDLYFEARDKAVKNTSNLNIDIRLKEATGDILWINHREEALTSDNGMLIREGLIIDITARKKAEEALKASEGKFRSFVENSFEVFYTMNLEAVFTYISSNCFELFGHDKKEVVGKSAFEGLVYPGDIPMCRERVKQMVETGIGQTGIEYRIWHGAGRWVWISTSIKPIFDADGKIRSFQGITFDITERKKVYESLRKSEERFRSFVENANDIIYTLTEDGILTYASPNCTTVLGYAEDQFMGRSVFDTVVHRDDIEYCKRFISEVLHSGKSKAGIEHRVKCSNQEWRTFITNAAPLYDEKGKATAFLGIARDITEQKKAASALLESEQSYEKLFNSITEAIYIQDGEGRFLNLNQGAEKMYGYTREELVGKTPDFLAAPGRNDMKAIAKLIRETYQTGNAIQLDFWGRRKNGEIFPKEVIINKGRYFGKEVIIVTARDISERERNLAQIKESETRWQFALEGTGDGIWDLDTGTNKIYYSHNWKSMLGYSDNEIGDSVNEWEERIHPDDREAVLNSVKKHRENLSPMYESEYRLRCKDGSYKWILDRGKLIDRFSQDTAPRFIGIHTDITHRKLTEERLKESEKKFSRIFHLSPDVILLARLKDGVITDVNERVFEMSGYRAEEIVGKTTIEMKGWEDETDRGRFVHELKTRGRVTNFEKTFLTKSGEPRNTNLSAEIIEINGEQYTLTFVYDLTDRIKISAALKENNELLLQTGSLARVGGWVYDVVTRTSTLTAETYKMQELPEHTPITLQEAINSYHEDERQRLLKLLENATTRAEPFSGEFKKWTATGKSLLVRITCNPIVQNGVVTKLVGAIQDITEISRLEKELAAQQLHNQQLITELTIQEQETEREQLSNWLNDDINQVLAAVKMQLSLVKTGTKNKEDLLTDSYEKLNEAIRKISLLSNSIDTPSMIHFGFLRSVELLVDQINLRGDLDIVLSNEATTLDQLDHNQNLLLYRTIQEKLNNVIRHAKARHVTILISSGENELHISITDDGVGFDLASTKPGGSLQKMKSRLEYYKASMEIISAKGQGCVLNIRMPLKQ